MPFRNEEELAADVVAWLTDQGWDVYEEVQAHSQGPRADIVAIRSTIVWVVECKMSFGLDVIAQANGWAWHAIAVSVAVPSLVRPPGVYGPPRRSRQFAESVCRQNGVGVIHVKPLESAGEWDRGEWGYIAPAFRRVRRSPLRNAVHNEHKRFRAGNANAEYHTPWRATCEELARVVRDAPGLTIKDALTKMRGHHYATDANARASLVKWARLQKVRGVRLDKSERPYRFYPADTPKRGDDNGT